jgi:hypothetical protein
MPAPPLHRVRLPRTLLRSPDLACAARSSPALPRPRARRSGARPVANLAGDRRTRPLAELAARGRSSKSWVNAIEKEEKQINKK